MSYRFAAALFSILFVSSPASRAQTAPSPDLALQGILTGDKEINQTLSKEYLKGYDDGYRGRPDASLISGPDKTKPSQGKLDRALEQSYRRGYSLGRRDKATEDEKASKQKSPK